MAEVTTQEREVTVKETRYLLDLSADEFEFLKGLVGDTPVGDSGDASSRLWQAMKSPAQAPAAPGPGVRAYVYKGAVYDLSAEYLDSSSDTWKFTGQFEADGMPLMSWTGSVEGDITYRNRTLADVLRIYDGNLTKRS